MPRFSSTVFEHVGKLPEFDQLTVKNEPMLFNCDLEHAYEFGGPITKSFLDALPEDWKDVPLVIDSRVHMLMPGWYPCIPGWHHDDVPRTRSDGQPNYGPGQDRSQHIMALINADIAPTEFALGTADFTDVGLNEVCYSIWHKEVGEKIASGELTLKAIETNTLFTFDDRTWHRGVAAKRNGWRWFARCSRYHDAEGNPIARRNERTNEVRRQVQIYMSSENAGW